MVRAIISKEWKKLRVYFFGLSFLCFLSVVSFAYNLNFSFSMIEPESMMWYRFVNLEEKPYFDFWYLFLFISFVISFAQFFTRKNTKQN